jgi:hypothetical protein
MTKRRKTIKALWSRHEEGHKLSKQDEVDYLFEIQDSLPEHCYLADLFTADFISWAAQMIRTDSAPDMYGSWTYDRIQLTERIDEMRKALEFNTLSRNTTIQERETDIKRLTEQVNDYATERNRYQTLWDEARGDLALAVEREAEAAKKIRDLQVVIEGLSAEVTETKAILWDLNQANEEITRKAENLAVDVTDLDTSEEQALLEVDALRKKNAELMDRLAEADLLTDEEMDDSPVCANCGNPDTTSVVQGVDLCDNCAGLVKSGQLDLDEAFEEGVAKGMSQAVIDICTCGRDNTHGDCEECGQALCQDCAPLHMCTP